MAHMRTLHRLLNSCTSGKSDSLVPKAGPLPSALTRLIGRKLDSVTPEFSFVFTVQHAHVVDAFMQTLVSADVVNAMARGEIEFLGDNEAKKHRGTLVGRPGSMQIFAGVEGVNEPEDSRKLQSMWVVKAVGNCVLANIDTARREEDARSNV